MTYDFIVGQMDIMKGLPMTIIFQFQYILIQQEESDMLIPKGTNTSKCYHADGKTIEGKIFHSHLTI